MSSVTRRRCVLALYSLYSPLLFVGWVLGPPRYGGFLLRSHQKSQMQRLPRDAHLTPSGGSSPRLPKRSLDVESQGGN